MRPVDRLLVRAPNWLGDAVLALPAMATIRRHFPTSHLTIAAVPGVAHLFREETDAAPDAVLELPRSKRAAVAQIEGGGFDAAILFPNSLGSAWQVWRAKVPERWGYARSGRRWLLSRVAARPASRDLHQADYYRTLVEGLGMQTRADDVPRLAPREPSRARADALCRELGLDFARPIVGLAPGAAYGQAKQWPPDRMADVAAALVDTRDVSIVIVGATHDRDAARAIESWVRTHAPRASGRIVNLSGRTSLGALIGLVSRMAAFVSNDSGAMHLAAAVGCPVVAVFGPTNERATRPLGSHTVLTAPVFCRPCMLRDCPIDHRCMKRIRPASVTEAVLTALDRPAGAR